MSVMFSFKKMAILSLTTALLLSLSFSISSAQTKKKTEDTEWCELNGRVLNAKTGEAISEAKVQIVDSEKNVKTDEDGRFTFEKVSEGKHMLKIEKEGYRKWAKIINVREGLRVVLSVKPESEQ